MRKPPADLYVERYEQLSTPMRRALSAIRDGKRITNRSAVALEKRGLVRSDGQDGWLLTVVGAEYAD